MKHNHEIHGNLARLLSTENLNIEHSNVETASFNVETRTLVLPIWENASDLVYQMLLSHESAHAIYTPNVDWKELTDVPMQFLNVTEDVRIEKLMKKKYSGLKKTFFGGYKELHEKDFFEINGKDHNKYNLADRVNLYFKIGNFINIIFTEEEKNILGEIEDVETFEDSIRCAEKLYEYCKQEHQKETDFQFSVDDSQENNEKSQSGENNVNESNSEKFYSSSRPLKK
jgi:hypothetical protein